jgi:heptosyltransferase-1
MPQPQAILIIRLSALGDIVMASALVGLLRARYPEARIAWLVQPEGRELLEANPALDEVIVWPRGEWRRLWRGFRWWQLLGEIRRFRRELRARHFDLAIDLQGLLKSAIWAWWSGARERIGLDSKEGSARFMTRVIEEPRGDKRIGSEYRHLAEALGLAGEFRMRVALTEADRRFARDFAERERLAAGYAVICPFTTRPQKHWVESYWPELVRRLREEFGLGAVMLGGPGDRVVAARLREAGGGAIVDAVGGTRLREAAALIEGARLLVGVDTGLTHMGTAFEIPTIAIFGSTCPYLRTDSPRTAILYKNLECSPCKRNPTCGGAYTCMRLVTVDEVMAETRRLLGEQR